MMAVNDDPRNDGKINQKPRAADGINCPSRCRDMTSYFETALECTGIPMTSDHEVGRLAEFNIGTGKAIKLNIVYTYLAMACGSI